LCGRAKHPLKQWAEDLGLTGDQRSQIKDAMKAQWKLRDKAEAIEDVAPGMP
jgi:Spy/CpxP family protein refolding chaperone